MAEQPETEVRFDQFAGMLSNACPRDVPPSQSTIQVNVAVLRPGDFALRRGLRPLQFDSESQ